MNIVSKKRASCESQTRYKRNLAKCVRRLWGGCGGANDNCREQEDGQGVTICNCRGDKCNVTGYNMPYSSVSMESSEHK